MANVDVWRHEARRSGLAAVTAPALAAATLCVVGAATGIDPGPLAVWSGNAVVALAAGLAVVSAVARESALELQLTLPTDYARTVLRRITPPAVIGVSGGTAAAIVLAMGDVPVTPGDAVFGAWGFILLAMAVGMWGTVLTGSAAGGSALVLGAWVMKLFFLDRLPGPPVVQLVLFASASAAFVVLALRRMGDAEALLNKENRTG